MVIKKILAERNKLRLYVIVGVAVGAISACIEYFAKLQTEDEQEFIPLIIRATVAGAVIMGTAAIFEILSKGRFSQRTFGYVLLVRSLVYTFIITGWLLVINGIWYIIDGPEPVENQLIWYLHDPIYLINLFSILFVVVVAVGLGQINSLHRRGELLNFILGRYHRPREVNRVFCFIDLKNSTSIAEKLGHVHFAMFLKDYYSDISEALRRTDAQIYQYIGDEIALSWSFEDGLKNNNCIHCYFEMKKTFAGIKERYLTEYGTFPEFRAGVHGGAVIVTWVGELKKEIVFIGDVVNTTARIREDCKRLGKDFLISEDVLKHVKDLEIVKAVFVEETIPRGKAKSVKLYSLEMA